LMTGPTAGYQFVFATSWLFSSCRWYNESWAGGN